MKYAIVSIPDPEVPRAGDAAYQHVVDTYASETNKTASVWACFSDADLPWRAAERSATVEENMRHQLLSERRFFHAFLGTPGPEADEVLPEVSSVQSFRDRLVELARPRLAYLAARDAAWWLEPAPFFDVSRERIWIFWRRVLHSAHHRTQLTVYLRLLGRPVPPTYGPTADVTWDGADPTTTVEAASRG